MISYASEDVKALDNLNPFRYRSYYFDTETNLYYLQTRYYDPEIGRFINIDSIEYADPETINGLNLYAYCGNNPIKYVDPTGCSWSSFWSKVGRFLGGMALGLIGGSLAISGLLSAATGTTGITQLSTVISEFGLTIGMYGAALMGSVFDSEIYSDMASIGWNPYNTNASSVVASQKMSFYKGVPIIRTKNMGGSMSLGIIFLDKNHGVSELQHEAGHSIQLTSIGLGRYLFLIGIPSYWKNDDYTPWELSASILGGSSLASGGTKKQSDAAKAYFALACFQFANIGSLLWYVFY